MASFQDWTFNLSLRLLVYSRRIIFEGVTCPTVGGAGVSRERQILKKDTLRRRVHPMYLKCPFKWTI